MDELISVIVPVYNAEQYLWKCVVSILEQTYPNFELILVNDGSTDASLEICKDLAARDSRIVVLSRSNGGASAARNTGLDAVHGSRIVFIDSDDFVSPNYLENLYLAAKSGNYDIVQCNLKSTDCPDFNPESVLFSPSDVTEITKSQALNRRLYKVSIWGKIYVSSLFDSFRFPEGTIYEDDASYYILVDRSEKLAILKETLYYYYLSANSVMRNSKKDKSTAFLQIYEDRIRYFQMRKDRELLDGSYGRFCLVLMLSYSSSLVNGSNMQDRKTFLSLYRKYYPLVMKSGFIDLGDKLMFLCFRIAPPLVGKIIGRLRSS